MTSATTRSAPRTEAEPDGQSPSADLVRVYLNGIGKTALLKAEDEVELSKRVEAGLYAQHILATKKRIGPVRKSDLKTVVAEGEAARSHLLEANLRLVVSLAKRYTGRGMPLLDLGTGTGTGRLLQRSQRHRRDRPRRLHRCQSTDQVSITDDVTHPHSGQTPGLGE